MKKNKPLDKWLPLLAMPIKLLPARLLQPVIHPCLLMIEKVLDENDWKFFNDKWIEINMSDIQWSVLISTRNRQLFCSPTHMLFSQKKIVADATISGTTSSFLKLVDQQVDPESLFFQRQLKLSGDTELGYWFKAILDRIDRNKLPSIFKGMSDLSNKLQTRVLKTV